MSGPRTSAEPGQRVRLVPGAGDRACQLQGGPVCRLGLIEAAPGAVECSGFVERLGLAAAVAGACRITGASTPCQLRGTSSAVPVQRSGGIALRGGRGFGYTARSEEHTSE